MVGTPRLSAKPSVMAALANRFFRTAPQGSVSGVWIVVVVMARFPLDNSICVKP
jgi:hypothetical protein